MYDLKKRAKEFQVPTDDTRVKLYLRMLGKPITLFGEQADFRRERLKEEILAFFLKCEKAPDFRETTVRAPQGEHQDASGEQISVFYTEGSQELKQARWQIA